MPLPINADTIVALLTLTLMEIILGIDNIIFIAIIVARMPKAVQAKARNLGLGLALFTRIALLFSLSWIMSLKDPFFSLFEHEFSGRDLILLFGGLFLIFKATFEIHEKLESDHSHQPTSKGPYKGFVGTLIQIGLLDIVFSLDSVITAVGMANHVSIMIVAMVIAVLVMLLSAGYISNFVEKHPTVKILALSFLLLIGVSLVAEGTGAHLDKGYIYFAMAFSFFVESINLYHRKKLSQKK